MFLLAISSTAILLLRASQYRVSVEAPRWGPSCGLLNCRLYCISVLRASQVYRVSVKAPTLSVDFPLLDLPRADDAWSVENNVVLVV